MTDTAGIRPVLEARNVSKVFMTASHEVKALTSVSLSVARGECLAIVGESGSGKTTFANMLLGIYPPSTGEMFLDGDLLPVRRTLQLRRAIQLVQQNPLSSLNPRRSVGASVSPPLGYPKMFLSRLGDSWRNSTGRPASWAM